MKTLTFGDAFTTSFKLGMRQVLNITGAYLLWVLTIWIPYINVGTTIGLIQIQIDVGKGKTINPADIFNANHRAVMGKMFLLWSFMTTGIIIGLLFFVIPGIVLIYAWFFSSMLILDKKLDPIQAMSKSYEITYGHKWTIFFVLFLIQLLVTIVINVLNAILLVMMDSSYEAWALLRIPYWVLNIVFQLGVTAWIIAAYGYMYSVLSGIKKK